LKDALDRYIEYVRYHRSLRTYRTYRPILESSKTFCQKTRTLQQGMGHRDIASTMVYLKGVRNRDIQSRLNKGSLAAFA